MIWATPEPKVATPFGADGYRCGRATELKLYPCKDNSPGCTFEGCLRELASGVRHDLGQRLDSLLLRCDGLIQRLHSVLEALFPWAICSKISGAAPSAAATASEAGAALKPRRSPTQARAAPSSPSGIGM